MRVSFYSSYGTVIFNILKNLTYRNCKDYADLANPVWAKAPKWVTIEFIRAIYPCQGEGKKLLEEAIVFLEDKYKLNNYGFILLPVPLDYNISFDYISSWYKHQGFLPIEGYDTLYRLQGVTNEA